MSLEQDAANIIRICGYKYFTDDLYVCGGDCREDFTLIRKKHPPEGDFCCKCRKSGPTFVADICQTCVITIHQSFQLVSVANNLEFLFKEYLCEHCQERISQLRPDVLKLFKPIVKIYTDIDGNIEEIDTVHPKWPAFPVI